MGINYIDTKWGNLTDLDYKKLNAMTRNQVQMNNFIENYPKGLLAWRKVDNFTISSTTPTTIDGLTINLNRNDFNFNSTRTIKVSFIPIYYQNSTSTDYLFVSVINIAEKYESTSLTTSIVSTDNVLAAPANYDLPGGSHVITSLMKNLPGVTTFTVQCNLHVAGSLNLPSGAYMMIEDLGPYVWTS